MEIESKNYFIDLDRIESESKLSTKQKPKPVKRNAVRKRSKKRKRGSITLEKYKLKLYIQEALNLRESTLVHYVDVFSRLKKRVKFSTELQELKNFGSGVYLFFFYSKLIAIIFSSIALFSLIKCILLSNANGLEKVENIQFPSYLKYTLTNLIDSDEDKIPNKFIFFFFDLAPITILTIFLLYFKVKKTKVDFMLDNNYFTTKDYAIQVNHLQPGTTKDEVEECFKEFGPIVEIYLFKKYTQTLKLMKEINGLKEDIPKLKKLQGLSDKDKQRNYEALLDYKERIEELEKLIQEKKETSEVFCAFVIFEYPKSKKDVIKAEKKSKKIWGLYSDSPFEINEKKVQVESPPNPSNINFENLEYNKYEKWFRKKLVSLISVALIFTSFFLTTFTYSKTNTNNSECEIITSEEFSKIENPTQTQKKCYCSSLAINEQLNTTICEEFTQEYFFSILIGLVASFILYIANFIIQTCQKLFAKFAKYHTYIEEYNSLLVKIYIPIFVNTALLIPLVYSDVFGLKPGEFLMKLYSKEGEFETFNSLSLNWFLKVGTAVTTSMVVNIFAPMIGVVKQPILLGLKKIIVKGFSKRSQIVNYLKPANFGFHYRFAYALMTCSFCLIFEPILPYAPILSAFTLWLAYFSNKFVFTKYSRKPPQFNSKMMSTVLNRMILFSLLNSIIKVYAYGNKTVFPDSLIVTPLIFFPFYKIFQKIFGIEDYDNETKYDKSLSGSIQDFKNTNARNQAISGFLSLQILAYIFFFLISYFFNVYQKCQKRKKQRRMIKNEEDLNDLKKVGGPSFTRMRKKLATYCLITYDIKQNPKYMKYFESAKTIVNTRNSPLFKKIKNIEEEKKKNSSPNRERKLFKKKKVIKKSNVLNKGVNIFMDSPKNKEEKSLEISLKKIEEEFDYSFKKKKKFLLPAMKKPEGFLTPQANRQVNIVKKGIPKRITTPLARMKNKFLSKSNFSSLAKKRIDNKVGIEDLETPALIGNLTSANELISKRKGKHKKSKKKKKDRKNEYKRAKMFGKSKGIGKGVGNTLKLYEEGKIDLSKEDVKELRRMKFLVDCNLLS